MQKEIELATTEDTYQLGLHMGRFLKGGEVFELIGDIGAGKTTFVKGLAQGMGIETVVQSPSYTISQQYISKTGISLHHYDLYRLTDPGLVGYDFQESVHDPLVTTVVEWADTAKNILPDSRIVVTFTYKVNGRKVMIDLPEELSYITLA